MLDTYQNVFNKINLHAPGVSSLLARDWVTNAFRQLTKRRRWSWTIKYGEFIFPQVYNTGTVTTVQNSNVITGSGTNWDNSLVGRQFRVGVFSPIYTVVSVPNTSQLLTDLPWGAGVNTNVGYQIYLAYVTPPSDFYSFISIWDPNYNWQLWLNVHQEEINAFDAQRSNIGPSSYLVSARDYSTIYAGTVDAVLAVSAIGDTPVSTSQGQGYTGVNNTTYSIIISTTGIGGVSTYKWKQDNGSFTTGVTSSTDPQDLSNGVQVYFPASSTFQAGDVFIINCSANLQGGLQRYEFWPHKQSQYVFPYLYESVPPDLNDVGSTIPRYVTGDILLEMGLASCARYPGTKDNPNPYFNPLLEKRHTERSEQMIMEIERKDDNVSEQDAKYQYATSLPFCSWPFDSNWMQSHDV